MCGAKSYSCAKPRRNAANGGYAHVVAAGKFVERRALRAASAGLGLLRRGECRGSAHLLPLGLGAAPALGGAGADQVALLIVSAREYHHLPSTHASFNSMKVFCRDTLLYSRVESDISHNCINTCL